MGALNSKDMGSGTPICFGHWVLLAGCLLATLPVFASFLPIDLGIDPRLEPIPMVLHLAAGICAIGLSITFLTTRDRTLWAVSHPIVLAALFVAAWSVLTAPLADYPWLSLIGVPVFGEAAVRYASLAAFFGAALVLAADRRTFVGLCAILVTVSVLTPIVMFMWGRSFFVSLDLVGYFAIPAALGDNIFCGTEFDGCLDAAVEKQDGATVFVTQVAQPERYGVMSFDANDAPLEIIEKPVVPPSGFAVTGLYIYDSDAVAMARELVPSARGEIEITDLNNQYLASGRMQVVRLPDSVSWLDMGTPQGLLEASQLVAQQQREIGVRIGVPEQVALRSGWIDRERVMKIALSYGANDYGGYLRQLVESG